MRIKTILNKLFLIGKMFLFIAIFSFLSGNAEAEYFLVSDAPMAVCMSGCGTVHKVKKYKKVVKRKYYKPRYVKVPRSGYSISVYYVWRDVPACTCGDPWAPRCNCCYNYMPAAYTQTQFYDVYYRQPAHYRDYRDRYDDGYYSAYNNDMRTGDDRAIGMDIDY